jgi:preprotein translocase subunit SecD
MSRNLKFRAIAIVAVILACIYGIVGIPKSKAELIGNFNKNIKLGLDLKGGSQLVMQVQLQDAFKAEADSTIDRIKEQLSTARMTWTDMNRNDPDSLATADSIQINITGIPANQTARFRSAINENFGDVWILTPVNPTDYRLTMKPSEALRLRQDALTQSINTIDKKVNGLGLSEATVQQRGRSDAEAEILVQLPGVDDPARVKQILQTQAVLELYEVQGGPFASREEAMTSKNGVLPLTAQILPSTVRPGAPREYYILARTPVVRGRDLRDSRPQQDQNGRWETTFVLTQDAATRFAQFTGANIGNRLAIVLDKMVLSAPTIQARISDNGVITGIGEHDEAADLALNLRSGSLPAGLEVLEERTVGPSLGNDSIQAGLYSGVAGVIAVVALMLVYYKRSGVNATLALILNAIILIAVLGYAEAVLTLPGIAGVILTIGMAVDSNVLIFERIREELRVTTVVSCAFLFLFGTTQVKGFAVTLVIGLLANLFTAVFVSRTIFDWELGMQKRTLTLSI